MFLFIHLLLLTIQTFDFSGAEQPKESHSEEAWVLGYEAFNFSPELIPFFQGLSREYQISVAIETGTFEGRTAAGFAQIFKQVHTIEISEEKQKKAAKKLSVFPNVISHLGNSSNVLKELLPQYQKERILFYLDAHGLGDWPLLAELKTIAETHKDQCIVVIDDFKVPTRPDIPYDAYGSDSCSYEYIEKELGKIFTDCKCMIVIPKNIAYRAKFVAIPRSWGGLENSFFLGLGL